MIDKIFSSSFFATDLKATCTTTLILLSFGVLLGCLVPVNDDLSPGYAVFSNIIGFTYFLAWTVSFYPQIYLNWRRKTTLGMSVDYQLLNLLGHSSYCIFNCTFYFSKKIQDDYRDRYDEENKVAINDVLFSVHAVAATLVTLYQVIIYDGSKQAPSVFARSFVAVALTISSIYFILIAANTNGGKVPFDVLDGVYFLSYVKIAVTLTKYWPQAILNYTRQSTDGWSIFNVVLDLMGGALSLLQLLLDCWDTNDWSGIVGDIAKFCLGLISIVFDVVFWIQHYILYPHNKAGTSKRPGNDYKAVTVNSPYVAILEDT